MPNDSAHRPPLPEEQQKQKAGDQHISAAFRWFRDDSCPRALKPLARHHAVLNGEKP
jgi:hypothetical protein